MTLRWFSLLLLSLLLLRPALSAPPTLRMGGFAVAPLMLGGPEQPVHGALPDFIRSEIAPQTRIRFVWQPVMSFARALRSLRDGSVDVLLMYSADGAQSREIGRYDWVYLQTAPQLAVLESSSLREVGSLDELAGLQIGWVSGSKAPRELAALPIHWQPASGQNWQTINLRKLAAKRIQAAYYANPYSPVYLARQQGVAIRLVPLPMPARPFTMAYSMKTDPALIAEFGALAAKAFKGERFKQYLEAYR
ncbi:transporter substrate-binding domain-containing protein [Paucibacter sp. O1-1]|nr:transporter substrate-binding domain-containing protein [Paucibacter sp. O1-1]MDA3829652.1 transporter substrate-binding domain-containing protein [Paucibacter sp. O1-1]